MCQELWLADVQFLRYGAWQTDSQMDGQKKSHIEVGAPPNIHCLDMILAFSNLATIPSSFDSFKKSWLIWGLKRSEDLRHLKFDIFFTKSNNGGYNEKSQWLFAIKLSPKNFWIQPYCTYHISTCKYAFTLGTKINRIKLEIFSLDTDSQDWNFFPRHG